MGLITEGEGGGGLFRPDNENSEQMWFNLRNKFLGLI